MKIKKQLKEIKVIRKLYFLYRFVLDNKYFPNFKKPKTFNEKINYRKNNPKNNLFPLCSDKIEVKKYVANILGDKYIIPTLFEGGEITSEKLLTILKDNEECYLKANHNSGPVYLITQEMSLDKLTFLCDDINNQLKIDFGKYQNERWYSDIEPRVLVEKRIKPEINNKDLKDFKFHVFRQADGSQKIILHVDFDRSTNHNRSFFDVDLNWLPVSIKYPSIKTKLDIPENYDEMIKLVKKLAVPFSYVRVDLYNVNGSIYFGELTFAHESGDGSFPCYSHDLWMGKMWQEDPSY